MEIVPKLKSNLYQEMNKNWIALQFWLKMKPRDKEYSFNNLQKLVLSNSNKKKKKNKMMIKWKLKEKIKNKKVIKNRLKMRKNHNNNKF